MEYAIARENMVVGQLKPNKVSNQALLQRFRDVPREFFVDVADRVKAYSDCNVSVGQGRFMFAPITCGRLIQEMGVEPEDNVLVAAAGTCYSAALLAGMASSVTAVENNPNLGDLAKRALSDVNASNVEFVARAPEKGCAENAPFDKILIDAPVDEIPEELVKQLKEGGKIGVVKKQENTGLFEAAIYTKQGKTLFEHGLFETNGFVLENFARQEGFVF